MQRLVSDISSSWSERSESIGHLLTRWRRRVLIANVLLAIGLSSVVVLQRGAEQQQLELRHIWERSADAAVLRLGKTLDSRARLLAILADLRPANGEGWSEAAVDTMRSLRRSVDDLWMVGWIAPGGTVRWLDPPAGRPEVEASWPTVPPDALRRARQTSQPGLLTVGDRHGEPVITLLQPAGNDGSLVALLRPEPLLADVVPLDGTAVVRLTGDGQILYEQRPPDAESWLVERRFAVAELSFNLLLRREPAPVATAVLPSAESLVAGTSLGATLVLLLLLRRRPLRLGSQAGSAEVRQVLSDAIEAIPDGAAILDADDRLVVCNSRFHEGEPGFKALLPPGMRFDDALRSAIAAGRMPDLLPGQVARWLDQRRGRPDELRVVLGRRDGTGGVQFSERRLPDGGSLLVRSALAPVPAGDGRESRTGDRPSSGRVLQLEEAVEALSEGFALYDVGHRLVLCNSKYKEIYWRTSDALVPGTKLETLLRLGVARGGYPVPTEENEAFILRRLAQHLNPGEPIEQKLSDGRWVQISDRRTADGGLVCVRTDITAMKRAEEAMRAAMEAAERANRAKTRFLAAASHDLRQPLHALGMFVAALGERAGNRETRQLIGNMASTLEALEALLNALLDISKLDAGAIEPHVAEVPLAPLLRRLQAECGPQARQQGLSFRVVPSSATIRSDPALLEALVRNLLSNALRYTVNGGILLGCRRTGDKIRIEIWDTGVGIPADQLTAIFQEFHRLNNAPEQESPGVGLGLAIVERTATLLGHSIDVRSRPGRGSMFAVEVPVCRKRAPESAVALREDMPRNPLAGHTLMIVDDDVAVLEGMRGLLEGWECHVLCAAGMDEAIDLFQRFGKPDLIVADYRLQRFTGLQVIEAVRGLCGEPVPAVLVTGDTAPGPNEAASAVGCAVLHKPVHPAKLRALLTFSLRSGAAEPLRQVETVT